MSDFSALQLVKVQTNTLVPCSGRRQQEIQLGIAYDAASDQHSKTGVN